MLISVDGARLFLDDQGHGRAIVLLHGFPLGATLWDDQAAALGASHRVLRPEFRGLGRSDVTAGPYLIEQLAGDVAGQLDALGVERVALVGHSLGGAVALAFFRLFSERVERLALVAPRVLPDSPEVLALRHELADRAEREGMAPIEKSYMARYFAPHFAEREPAAAARVRAVMQAANPYGAAAILRGLAQRLDSSDILADIRVPTLVIAAEQDAIIPRADIDALIAGIPGARLITLGCGHMPMVEEPAALSAALVEFFADY